MARRPGQLRPPERHLTSLSLLVVGGMCYDVSMSTSQPGRGKRPRSQRGAVEDRWRKRGKDEHGNTIEVPSAVAGKVTRWRARYVENAGKEHTRHFDRKVDAQKWLKEAMASIVRGDHVAPKVARLTVGEWSDKWLDGYRTRCKSTVRQAEVHLKLLKEHFGAVPMASVKPSDVRGWTAQLKAEGRADSYVYALHARLSQLFSDAVHDGIVSRIPAPAGHRPAQGNSGRTSQPRNRSGLCTTQYLLASDPRSCSALTLGCGLPRRQRYAPRTST